VCVFIPLLDLVIFSWRSLDSAFRVLASAFEFTLQFPMTGGAALISGVLGVSSVVPGGLCDTAPFSIFYLSSEVLANYPRTTILGYVYSALCLRLLSGVFTFYFNFVETLFYSFAFIWAGWA
jgi:hypothetical protein